MNDSLQRAIVIYMIGSSAFLAVVALMVVLRDLEPGYLIAAAVIESLFGFGLVAWWLYQREQGR